MEKKRGMSSEDEAATKKRRLDPIMEFIAGRKGMTFESSFFTWKDWDNGDGPNDFIYYKCVMLRDIRDDAGTILVAKDDKVDSVWWLGSNSAMIIYTDGADETAIRCPLVFAEVAGIPPVEKQQ